MRLLLIVVIGLMLSGCRAVEADEHTITVNGVERTYRLHRPPSLPAQAPLVVMLHGGFGSGRQAESAYGWDELADREGFVVAYPDGLNRAWAVGDGCCGNPGRTNSDDVAFIEQMIGQIKGINPMRVYATGMSNGAMMSYRLACDSQLFAAIAPVAGTMLGDCHPAKPVSILHIHGLADPNVPFDGSPGNGVARIDGPPIPEVLAFWRKHNGDSAPVELITIPDGGHAWPDTATEAIWTFYLRQVDHSG